MLFYTGLLFIIVAADAFHLRNGRFRRSTRNEYKMCVPEDLLELCVNMANEKTKSTAKIICIPARDRIECIDKIKARQADFGTVDPEDMYVASKVTEEDFAVFEEIRTREEPEAEFRYEGVAVVHKDLDIKSIKDLKGLNSCHTGVARNVGYKIPLTKLSKLGVIGSLADPDLSPRENELKALSTLFNKACIVGKWSEDLEVNSKLKQKYPNLCALCENPEKCDYPDKFSGYEGALRCLAHNGGQVAWTKVIFVRKFFGLPVGISPARPSDEKPEDFAYLCPDGTKVPVTGPACRWASRPWQGYMTNADVVKTVDELRRKIENLGSVGVKEHAPWLEKILELSDKTEPKENKIISPSDYLDKANYTDVIERDYGPPYKVLRFCVTSADEWEKCRTLSKSAFSRDIRPRFDCVQEKSVYDCMKTIRDNGADVITLDAGLVEIGQKEYNLRPILTEQNGNNESIDYAVAVVKKNSAYRSFADLKGAKSCHVGMKNAAGYFAPLHQLLKQNLIKKGDCPYTKAISDYFAGGSCLPGSKDPKLSLPAEISEKLCSLCDDASKCNFDSTEAYSGYAGAFRCLAEGKGDVAFVKDDTVPTNTDGKNKVSWAADLKSSDYELLCPDGSRLPVDQYNKCNLLKIPSHMVVTSNSKNEADIDEIKSAIVAASNLYTRRPDYFKLFGEFNGKKDLLFEDSARKLTSMTGSTSSQKEFSTLLLQINEC